MGFPEDWDALGLVAIGLNNPQPFGGQSLAAPKLHIATALTKSMWWFGTLPAVFPTVGLCAVGFLALPQSRRIAKVRWRHIGRIAFYSLAIGAIPITMHLLLPFAQVFFNTRLNPNAILAYSNIAIILFMIVWWSVATQHYLKMHHAWGVGLAVTIIAALLAGVLLVGTGWIFQVVYKYSL
jgi:hypothetical protein